MFDGPDYSAKYDESRLTGQIKRVREAMLDAKWRTLDEISRITHDPQASVSAQLRHLRKEKNGSHLVEKRRRGQRCKGLYEYRLVP